VLSEYIKRKLIWAWKFSHNPNFLIYNGALGIYTGRSNDEVSFTVYFRRYNYNYNGGQGVLLGSISI
jgi:hypothetical protein